MTFAGGDIGFAPAGALFFLSLKRPLEIGRILRRMLAAGLAGHWSFSILGVEAIR
ncbi:hypothetical protein FF011L_54860 [Roseimaritima multifibrata]|uniref:Uncharacterized protein n=1 Tax=Roseimaritima multifibrata TaxID=1930274 RepID=A0A517MP76_9BACT|nr:hypothetical protein FF011L_54860 [Roseimaritima multifibrata]